MKQQMSSCRPEGQPYAELHQKGTNKKVEESDSPPLFFSGETPSGVLRLPQVLKKGQRKITIGLEQFCYEKRLKGLELLSLEKTLGRTYCGLSSPLKRT